MQPASMETRQTTVAAAAPLAALPDDVLEDILGRLPARSLAASRQVCKAWRDIVDNRRLLLRLRRLLPHSLHGFFVNYVDHGRAHFFARPTPAAAAAAGTRIDGEFSFIEPEQAYSPKEVADHCNGLVLYWDDHKCNLYMCNPTTQRLSLSDGKYRVIKSPVDRAECYKGVQSFIGRSEKGVYFASIHIRRLRVWILKECPDQTEWILKHDRVLKPDDWWGVVCLDGYYQVQCNGPWILDDYYDNGKRGRNVDWSSDDDDIIYTVDWEENDNKQDMYPQSFHFLGFHPYKEVIFLAAIDVVVAYHWNTLKVQFLGLLSPNEYNHGVYDSFVYTPCYDTRHRG
ncbi:unnamed protein product [Urochloa decumbens]|uniref:F-box domain-containing protein n=1 Tax=Urochloa decumbens TaxID=240449 RepID=A0ABC9AGA9_9POAL